MSQFQKQKKVRSLLGNLSSLLMAELTDMLQEELSNEEHFVKPGSKKQIKGKQKRTAVTKKETFVVRCQQCNGKISQDCRVYKCVQCPDMLLCAECETDDRHQEHCVMRFPSTRIYDTMRDLFKSLQRGYYSKLSLDTNKTLEDVEFSDERYGNEISLRKPRSSKRARGSSSPSFSPAHHKDDSESEDTDDEIPVVVPKVEYDPVPDPLETALTDRRAAKRRKFSPSSPSPAYTGQRTVMKQDSEHDEILIKTESQDCGEFEEFSDHEKLESSAPYYDTASRGEQDYTE